MLKEFSDFSDWHWQDLNLKEEGNVVRHSREVKEDPL